MTDTRAVPTNEELTARLNRVIDQSGPISIAHYMAEANMHYYSTRDPLGVAGDFVTAPEISQMFGELIGLWCADLWMRAGSPSDIAYVELGPGRGTLARDALRAMAKVNFAPDVHFVETSPVLRAAQARSVPHATFHDDVTGLPQGGALLVIANEFFDALPIRQLVATLDGWRERFVARGQEAGTFVPVAGQIAMDAAVPDTLRRKAHGTIIEAAPAANAIIHDIASRIAAQGGAFLAIDYGYEGPATGDTLQAVHAHEYVSPFSNAGNHDLTAHVDFASLAGSARSAGIRVLPVIGQGDWLHALGLAERAQALISARPDHQERIAGEVDRLTDDGQMGRLFRVMAGYAPGWPIPEGFAN